MKVKMFFRMLMCSMALFALASCSGDDNPEDPSVMKDGKYTYHGNIVVTEEGGTYFTDEMIQLDLIINGADKKAKVVIRKVQFAEDMPVRVDVTIDGLDCTQTDKFLFITGNDIIPTMAGGPMAQYIVKNFKGELDLVKNELAMSMNCGSHPVSYLGRSMNY